MSSYSSTFHCFTVRSKVLIAMSERNKLVRSLCCQASDVNSEPGFIKYKRLALKSSDGKNVLLSKPLTCLLFSSQCLLCSPEGSCLIRSPNSVESTWSRIWGEENAVFWKAHAASARAGAADWCQPGRGCRSGHGDLTMITRERHAWLRHPELALQIILLEEEALKLEKAPS